MIMACLDFLSYVLVRDDGFQIVLDCVQQLDSDAGSCVPSLPSLAETRLNLLMMAIAKEVIFSEDLKWLDHLKQALKVTHLAYELIG